jgi:hypothetical protein
MIIAASLGAREMGKYLESRSAAGGGCRAGRIIDPFRELFFFELNFNVTGSGLYLTLRLSRLLDQREILTDLLIRVPITTATSHDYQ